MPSIKSYKATSKYRGIVASTRNSKRPIDDRVVHLPIDALMMNQRNSRRQPHRTISDSAAS